MSDSRNPIPSQRRMREPGHEANQADWIDEDKSENSQRRGRGMDRSPEPQYRGDIDGYDKGRRHESPRGGRRNMDRGRYQNNDGYADRGDYYDRNRSRGIPQDQMRYGGRQDQHRRDDRERYPRNDYNTSYHARGNTRDDRGDYYRSNDTYNRPRNEARHDTRHDARNDSRYDTRQDSRHDARQDSRHDARQTQMSQREQVALSTGIPKDLLKSDLATQPGVSYQAKPSEIKYHFYIICLDCKNMSVPKVKDNI